MKRIMRFLALCLAAASLAAFPPEASAQQKKHKPVQFITGSATATWFATGAMIAELTNAKYEGQPVSVVPGPGGVGNPPIVTGGQSDIGISYGPFLVLAIQGNNDMYKGAGTPELRAIAAGTGNKLHLVLDPESKLTDLSQLKTLKPKLRIATGPRGSTELFSIEEVLREYGVSRKDIESWGGRFDLVGSSERADAWNNRQADLVNFFINNPAGAVTELMSGRKAIMPNIDKSVRDALVKKWGFMETTIPANDYPNQPKQVETIGLPFVIFASTRLDAELVYDMTKAIAENKDRMARSHVAFKEWNPEDMPVGLGIQMHDGAARYYKERGWIK